jgi:hypothetical protein
VEKEEENEGRKGGRGGVDSSFSKAAAVFGSYEPNE